MFLDYYFSLKVTRKFIFLKILSVIFMKHKWKVILDLKVHRCKRKYTMDVLYLENTCG